MKMSLSLLLFVFILPALVNCSPRIPLERSDVQEKEWRDECADGEQMGEVGKCEKCDQGTYRKRGEHKSCISCPVGVTTEARGAVRPQDCNTPRCDAGQFLVVASKTCQLCPRGTYQDEPLQVTCKACPKDHTTSGVGSRCRSQCYMTDQCATGEDNCSWNAICEDLPDENDVPSFLCKCKPGYRGNGTYCEEIPNNITCTESSHCKLGSTCVNGKCICEPGMVLDDGWCRYKYAYPGESCASGEKCTGGSICPDDTRICKCPDLTAKVENKCVPAKMVPHA